jgi:hypothetical protein
MDFTDHIRKREPNHDTSKGAVGDADREADIKASELPLAGPEDLAAGRSASIYISCDGYGDEIATIIEAVEKLGSMIP